MVRILGSPGRSRRLRVGVALAACTALVVVMALPALAVHEFSFQLDGDIDDSTTTNIGGTTQTVDWETLFDASVVPPVPVDPLPAGFESAGFDRDFLTKADGSFDTSDSSTFATGSKDTLPITPGWQCNQDNNVLSKSDVMNAYAASFVVPSGPDAGDEILYFALERNANTGTGNVGFWFLQDEVACESAGGSTAFSGDHTDGDILVVSEFTQGGSVSTINAYRWDGGANGVLNPGSVAQGSDCAGELAGDDICANVNGGTLTGIPWLTSNKQDGPGNQLRSSEFFEGGINLTDTELGGRCFNIFIGDTRSSTSLTATIFDFSLGKLGGCESDIVTTPSDSTLSIGAGSVNASDFANVTVDGTDTWEGTLSFFICGPIATGTCDTGGLQIGTATSINQDTVMPVESEEATLTSAGRYCWRGFFDSNTDGVDDATDATEGECFVVNPVTPTLTTTAGVDVTLGTPITDTATLTGTANQPGDNGPNAIYPTINATNGAPANGTITWSVRGPGGCAESGLTVTGSPATVSGDATYGPVSATPTAIGTYTFVATYTGDDPNTLGASGSCPPGPNDGDEEVTVTGEAALSTAQDWLPNDTATITGPTALSGTATFTLFTGTDCGAGGDDTIVYGPVDVPVSGASPQTAETSNTTLVLEADSGGYSWLVSYDDTVLDDPDDTCETTTINIDDTL